MNHQRVAMETWKVAFGAARARMNYVNTLSKIKLEQNNINKKSTIKQESFH